MYCVFFYVDKSSVKKKETKFSERLLRLMRDMFGYQNVTWCLEDSGKIEIIVDSGRAILDPATLAVDTTDDGLMHLVTVAAKRLHASVNS